ELEAKLKKASPAERKAIDEQIAALKKRLSLSTPTLKDPADLARQQADLEKQLAAAKTPAEQEKLRAQIADMNLARQKADLEKQLAAAKTPAEQEKLRAQIADLEKAQSTRVPLTALQGGELGHGQNTNVTIQIIDANGSVIATAQGQNQGSGEKLHAEQVAL